MINEGITWNQNILSFKLITKALNICSTRRFTLPFRKKGVSKLLGLNYQIIYRRGKENKAVDPLSRRDIYRIGKLQKDKLEGGGFTAITKII